MTEIALNPTQEALIWKYISDNHVLSVTAGCGEEVWPANMFYATDAANHCVYVMSSTASKHGVLMQQQPLVSGTICDQVEEVTQLKGIQFLGKATVVSGNAFESALNIYQQRFPIARQRQEPLWKIAFTILKYTDNSLGFGAKLMWQKS